MLCQRHVTRQQQRRIPGDFNRVRVYTVCLHLACSCSSLSDLLLKTIRCNQKQQQIALAAAHQVLAVLLADITCSFLPPSVLN